MQQVDKTHYRFLTYGHLGRFASYYYQLKEIFSLNPETVLEVGVGDKVVGNFLKENSNIRYTGLDFAKDLKPDVVGDVRILPFASNAFDVVCAFEVLEHIPFDDFEKGLKEMARVSAKHVVISLPHFAPPFLFQVKIPLFPTIRLAWKMPWPKKHQFNGEHYWEIGKRGYSAQRIRQSFRKFFTITKEFIPFENQYHHFFVLEKLT